MRLPSSNRRKLLLVAASVLSTPLATADDKSPARPTIREGSPVSVDDLAELLDAQIWKFRIEVPPGNARFTTMLQIQEKGKRSRTIVGGTGGQIDQDGDRDVMIAIIPLNGSVQTAEKVRVVMTALGGTTSAIEVNPMRGKIIGRRKKPVDQKDGSFELMAMIRDKPGSPSSSIDETISWKIEIFPK